MIEIRELVIRANVDDSPRRNGEKTGTEVNGENTGQQGCCSDNIDLILQIIKDKKER